MGNNQIARGDQAETDFPPSHLAELASQPRLNSTLPLLSGRIKSDPLDFIVEEVPLYEPCGDGAHLFLWIEKRDTSGEHLIEHLARTLGVSRRDIGMAGLKDRLAVTRQYVSVPADCEPKIQSANTEMIRVLRATRHRNKLKTGHLRGNRFSIVLRGETDIQHAHRLTELIIANGFPNYFGEQRFGREGETAATGLNLLRGEITSKHLPAARRRFLQRLAFSAAQSMMFNYALAERIRDGLIHRVMIGDVMQVVRTGGPFIADDVDREQSRYEAAESAITGPIFGVKMKRPVGEAARREEAILAQFQVGEQQLRRERRLMPGTRRAYLIRPDAIDVTSDPTGLRFEFTLPKGVYATSLLREMVAS